MVVIMKQGFTPEQLQEAIQAMKASGVKVNISKGSETTVLGAEGNAAKVDLEMLEQLPGVERVMRVSEPYKKANRKYHPDDSVINIGGGVTVGGQKLASIAAWLHEPKLILMDEPFVGLDPKASHLLKKMMRQVCNEGGAIFFSTHVLEVAEKLCDKVAIIKGGRLIRSGTMEEVKGDESLEDVFLELEGEVC